jgi:uncharacterized protein YjbI with pentapeptide repeats
VPRAYAVAVIGSGTLGAVFTRARVGKGLGKLELPRVPGRSSPDDANLSGSELFGLDIEGYDLRDGINLDDVALLRRKLPGGALVDVATLAPIKLADEHMPLTLFEHRGTLAFSVPDSSGDPSAREAGKASVRCQAARRCPRDHVCRKSSTTRVTSASLVAPHRRPRNLDANNCALRRLIPQARMIERRAKR